jgi:hypothetical protein
MSASEEKIEIVPSIYQIHLLVNHSLENVHMVLNSSNEFIQFMDKIYALFEYEYEAIPIVFDHEMYSFTDKSWSEFCRHCEKEYGTEILYSSYTDRSPDYKVKLLQYATSYLTFHQKMDEIKSLFSIDDLHIVNEWKKLEKKLDKIDESLKESLENTEKNVREVIDMDWKEAKKKEWDEAMNKAQEEWKIAMENANKRAESLGGNAENYWNGAVQLCDNPLGYFFIHKEWADTKEDLDIKSVKTTILYEDTQNITFVVRQEDCQWIPKLISVIEGITILKEYNELLQPNSDNVYEYFHNRQFADLANAREQMDHFDLLHHLSKKRCEVERQIHSYITRNYSLSKDGKKLMKASVLQERIETALSDSVIGNHPVIESAMADTLKFRKLISSVLLELDLQKKRLSDGIYYYGIEPKIRRELEMTSALETVLTEREKWKEITTSRFEAKMAVKQPA